MHVGHASARPRASPVSHRSNSARPSSADSSAAASSQRLVELGVCIASGSVASKRSCDSTSFDLVDGHRHTAREADEDGTRCRASASSPASPICRAVTMFASSHGLKRSMRSFARPLRGRTPRLVRAAPQGRADAAHRRPRSGRAAAPAAAWSRRRSGPPRARAGASLAARASTRSVERLAADAADMDRAVEEEPLAGTHRVAGRVTSRCGRPVARDLVQEAAPADRVDLREDPRAVRLADLRDRELLDRDRRPAGEQGHQSGAQHGEPRATKRHADDGNGCRTDGSMRRAGGWSRCSEPAIVRSNDRGDGRVGPTPRVAGTGDTARHGIESSRRSDATIATIERAVRARYASRAVARYRRRRPPPRRHRSSP